jgi:hypothetical protein
MKYRSKKFSYGLSIVTALAASVAILSGVYPAQAADKRPNIVMLMTDDTGWNDLVAIRAEAPVLVIRHRMSIG